MLHPDRNIHSKRQAFAHPDRVHGRMGSRWIGHVAVVAILLLLVLSVGFFTGALLPFLGGYDPPEDPLESNGNLNDDHGPSDTDYHDGYEHTTVTVVAADGEEIGRVEAAIADTALKRYVGLSNTESLPETHGMLFVHDDYQERTYVMREMSFGIDIVFIDSDGTITEIHHAPAPGPDEDGSQQRYSGAGQYVLEVSYEWTDERNVSVGYRIEFDR